MLIFVSRLRFCTVVKSNKGFIEKLCTKANAYHSIAEFDDLLRDARFGFGSAAMLTSAQIYHKLVLISNLLENKTSEIPSFF